MFIPLVLKFISRAKPAFLLWAFAALSALATSASADPTVTTGSADQIQATTAVLTATVNPNGLATGVQFQFGLTTAYSSSTPVTAIGSDSSDVAVRIPVQGLTPGTTYHFRAVALVSSNSTPGSAFNGTDQTFVTARAVVTPPTVTTGTAAEITSTSAVANGTINPNGTPSAFRVDFGVDTTYGQSTPVQSLGSGTADVAVHAVLAQLKPATTYHFRVVALTANNGATSVLAAVNGADQTFTTTDATTTPPTVTTGAATEITSTSAVANGTINPNGTPTSFRVDFGVDTTYGHSTPVQTVGNGTADVAVHALLPQLTPATTYHFRVVAITATATGSVPATVNGADLTFKTSNATIAPPTVTTLPATEITGTSAVANGTINPNGTPTAFRVDFGVDTTYGHSTPVQSGGSGTADVAVHALLPQLTPATTYHFRVVALTANNGATSVLAAVNGADQTFTTTDATTTPPTVTTGAATEITSTSAVANGTINPNGTPTSFRVDFGVDTTYGHSTPVQTVGNGTADVAVHALLPQLTPATTYHFRVVAISATPTANAPVTVNGADLIFKTTDATVAPPTVTTRPATEITGTSAVANGTINPNGTPTAFRVDFGVDTTYGHSTPVQSVGNGTADVAVHALLPQLTPATTYHFRVVAITATGTTGVSATVNGADLTFKTTDGTVAPPTVTTRPATEITSTSGVANGTVNPNGTPTAIRFEFGLDTTYGHSTPVQSVGSGTADVAVHAPLVALTPATTYHFRIVAITATNTGSAPATVNGADQTFTTAPLPIGTSTTAATAITTTSATLHGSANPNGNATTVHFEYGIDTTYGASTPAQQAGSGSRAVAVSADLTGLSPHTSYHFRLVATDGTQTKSSADRVFRTTNSIPKAANDLVILSDHAAVSISVLTNDSDADGDKLTITRVTQGSVGAVVDNGDGTLTYTPGANFNGRDVFTYRVEDGFGGAASATVTVQSALYAASGAYNGLVTAATPAHETSGYLRVTTTVQGAFTGSLKFAGGEFVLKGAFDANGDFTTTLGTQTNAAGTPATTVAGLALALHLDTTPDAQQITGTVSTGSSTSALVAPRSPYGTAKAAPQAGQYTILIPATAGTDSSLTPGGTGFAVMTVSRAGLITVSGRLGDGAQLSAGAVLNGDGTFPLYAGLYAVPRGSIFGMVTFRAVENLSDCDGSVRWFKPAQTVKTTTDAGSYPAGFAVTAGLIGSVYATEKTHRVLNLSDGPGNASVEFEEGNLLSPLTKVVTISPNNAVVSSTTALDPFTMTITATSGLFSGYFVHPGKPAASARTLFQGVIFQAQNLGAGMFLGLDQSGAVSVSPVQATTTTTTSATP